MYAYTINKIVSLLIPALTIVIVAVSVPMPQSWTILLVLVSMLGYTHYLIGAYYQQQAWRRRANYSHYLGYFLLLSVISIGCVVLANSFGLLWLIALLTIPYFVWHGYENEHTLFTRVTGLRHSSWLLAGMSFVVVGATTDAFRHSSANFTYSLIYTNGLLPKFTGELAYLDPYIYAFGFGLMILGCVMIWTVTMQHRSLANLFWSLMAAVLLLWFNVTNPLPYVWLFVFLLSYHFITWALHYGVVFWPQPKRFIMYLLAHGGVIVGIVMVSMGVSHYYGDFPLGLLNGEFFLAATLIHISTSFLNDVWLQKALGL